LAEVRDCTFWRFRIQWSIHLIVASSVSLSTFTARRALQAMVVFLPLCSFPCQEVQRSPWVLSS